MAESNDNGPKEQNDSYDMELWQDKDNKIPFISYEIHLEELAQRAAAKNKMLYIDQEEFADARFANAEVQNRILQQKKRTGRGRERLQNLVSAAWDPTDAPGLIIPTPRPFDLEEEYVAARKADKEALREKTNTLERLNYIKTRKDNDRVWIMIDQHYFRRLYSLSSYEDVVGKKIEKFQESEPLPLPDDDGHDEGIDKTTLMRCSSLARDYFAWYPRAKILHLPLRYPRFHARGDTYHTPREEWMAHIHPGQLLEVLIPWFSEIESTNLETLNRNNASNIEDEIPRPTIPIGLDEKIHLYNAMLQLGVPRFVQRPLIETLCKQMYQTPLTDCHLELLEITIGRLNSKTVATVDPVLSCFAGIYGQRHREDRNHAGLRPESIEVADEDLGNDSDDAYDEEYFDQTKRRRRYFDYNQVNAGRKKFPQDAVFVQPILPVLAHTIRHWAGIGRNNVRGNRHMGYPLHIGPMRYYRRETGIPEELKIGFWPNDTENITIGEMRLHSEYDVLYPTTRLVGRPGKRRRRAAHWDPAYDGPDAEALDLGEKTGADYW